MCERPEKLTKKRFTHLFTSNNVSKFGFYSSILPLVVQNKVLFLIEHFYNNTETLIANAINVSVPGIHSGSGSSITLLYLDRSFTLIVKPLWNVKRFHLSQICILSICTKGFISCYRIMLPFILDLQWLSNFIVDCCLSCLMWSCLYSNAFSRWLLHFDIHTWRWF